jgi:hypothetical protein
VRRSVAGMTDQAEPPNPTECQASTCRWDTVRALTGENSMWVHPRDNEPDHIDRVRRAPILSQRLRIHRVCYDAELYSPV